MSAGADAPWMRAFTAWEKAAAEAAGQLVRDPQVLALGADMLRAHLLWRRAMTTAFEAALTPFAPATRR